MLRFRPVALLVLGSICAGMNHVLIVDDGSSHQTGKAHAPFPEWPELEIAAEPSSDLFARRPDWDRSAQLTDQRQARIALARAKVRRSMTVVRHPLSTP